MGATSSGALTSCLRDDDAALAPLQALFTRGGASYALSLFLAHKPGEHGLKQAARAIDAALSGAHNRTCISLASALQGVVFLLGELGGLLQSSPAYAGLGIQVHLL
jgi:hypothetical protein